MRITSGFRNKESQAKAMEDLRVADPKQYEKNYGLSADNDSSTEKWLETHASKHQSGNAIDVSYPKSIRNNAKKKESFLASLNRRLSSGGGYAVGEGHHIHINTGKKGQKVSAADASNFETRFDSTQQSMKLAELTEANVEGKSNIGQGGGNIVAPNNSQTNISNTTQQTIAAAPTAEDSWWNKLDRLLD